MNTEIMLEDVLEEEIINVLRHMYSFSDYEDILTIFFLRCMIYNSYNLLTNEDILSFLYRELNLPKSKTLLYKNTKIFKNYYGFSNSLESIVDNWRFKVLDKTKRSFNNKIITKGEILSLKYNDYLTKAKKELKNINKSSKYYIHSIKHLMMLFLYKDYNIEYINNPKQIGEISYLGEEDFNNNITIDLEYIRYYNALCFEAREKERELEDYIYNKYFNKSLLFGDIKIIGRQYKTKAGILDLLGKDSNGNIVIIELKVVNRPIDIFYQIKAYTSHIKREFNVDKVRFIAITPKLKDDIYEEIIKEDIELYYYNKKTNKYAFNKVA